MPAALPAFDPPLPPQALPVSFVFYENQFGKVPSPMALTWDRFADWLAGDQEVSPCTVADGPNKCAGKECRYKSHSTLPNNPMAWAPTEIEGKRLDANVRFLTMLVLDFDHLTSDEARVVLGAIAPYECVLHTTHNHRAGDDNCFRAILALSRKVHANQWHRFLAAAIAKLGVTVVKTNAKGKPERQPDPTCKNRSRYYYRPSRPKDAPEPSGRRQRGRVLDVDEVLAWGMAQLPDSLSSPIGEARPLPDGAEWDLASDAVQNAIDVVVRYFPDRQRHDLALALGGMLRRAGATEDDARYILREAFVGGGSKNPEMRAKTVEHTWSLTDDAAMTGFTRVGEILGEDAAREFGDYVTDAASEAFLRGMALRRVGQSAPGAASPQAPAPPRVVDLGELRKVASKLASGRARSDERGDIVDAILLRRVLDGRPLARPGGAGDVETRMSPSDECGVGREVAARRVAGLLAFHFPDGTPWAAAAEILRASVMQMPAAPGEDWMALAERAYGRAQVAKAVRREKEAEALEAYKFGVRSAMLAGAGGGGGFGGAGGPASSSAPPPPDGPAWRDQLTKGNNGAVANTLHNARWILRNHEDFLGNLRWNEITKTVEVTGGPIARYSKYGTEQIVAGIQDYLSSAHGIDVSNSRELGKRVVFVARENAYDPLKDYLNSLRWDGVPRISGWLRTYCGASKESVEYLEKVGRRWMISLVARGLDPGCKVDNVLVLESLGGVGKSTIFSVIGGQWFCDTAINLGDKDSRMLAGQYWLCELAECVSFKKSGHDVLKNFFSSQIDKFRPPYAAVLEEFPRRCVFVGTTNEDAYFVDETGNRKYLPVACAYTPKAIEALRRDRDQLLAEAVAAYRSGEKWHYDYEEIPLTETETEKRMVETPAKLKVASWWFGMTKAERPSSLTTLEVWELAFDAPASQVKDGDLMRIGHALKKLGFSKDRDSTAGIDGRRPWRYYASEKLLNADRVEPKRRGLFVISGGKTDDRK